MDPVVANIAAILDYPSVYMGGPSQQSLRKAQRIVDYLQRSGLIQKRKDEDDDD